MLAKCMHNIIRNTRTINTESNPDCGNNSNNNIQNLRKQGGNQQRQAFERREISVS